jgi:PAS domain S-box-containing protein
MNATTPELMKVLLVEELPGGNLESDADVRRASNGPELRQALAEEEFDAVLCKAPRALAGLTVALDDVRRDGKSPVLIVFEPRAEDVTLLPHAATQRGAPLSPLLKAIIDALPDAALLVDFASRRAVMNHAFCDLCHLPPAFAHEPISLAVARSPFPPALLPVIELLDRDGQSRATGNLELHGARVEWSSAPQVVGDEALGRLWTFRRDARVSVPFQPADAKYRSLIANIPDVVWTADARGRITFVSQNVIALDGYTPEEICAGGDKGWLVRVHPDEREAVAGAYAGLFMNELAFDVEYRVRHKDGRWIWLHDRAMSTYMVGKLRFADGVISNITARKAAEVERTRLTHERELLLDSAAEGIFGIDCHGLTTFVNRAAVQLLDYPAEELLGQSMHALVHPQCRNDACALLGPFRHGESRRVLDDVFRTSDGASVSVEYVASPVVDDADLVGAVVIFSDTTEKRALTRALEQTQRVAGLGRVAATMSHEFNNVLAGIAPFVEVVRREAQTNAKLIAAVAHMNRAIERGRGIAQQILRYTRPTPPTLAIIDLAPALEALTIELRAVLPDTCTLSIEVEAGLQISAEWPQIEQVLTNLAVNARDAMRARGSITLTASSCVASKGMRGRVADPRQWVHLTCADNGPGMPPQLAERIFEPLFTTKRHGTGLGLAVVQQVIDHHGGLVFVESEVGNGTTFHLLLRKP